MKLNLCIITIFAFVFLQQTKANTYQSFDKTEYYRVLKNGTLTEINNELSIIENFSFPEKNAFEGTLLMKKAGLVSKPKDKLDLFKTGRTQLETEISKNNSNVEYRFLRLIIEEHAPKVVKYRSDINMDADFIVKNVKDLSPQVQQIVIDYSKNSPPLKALDFQP